jgi:hypothetical protein
LSLASREGRCHRGRGNQSGRHSAARASGIRRRVRSSKIHCRCCRSLLYLAQPPSPPGLGCATAARLIPEHHRCLPARHRSVASGRSPRRPQPLAPEIAVTRTPEETATVAACPVQERRRCLPVCHRSVVAGRPPRRATTASPRDRRRSHARGNRHCRSLARGNRHAAKT